MLRTYNYDHMGSQHTNLPLTSTASRRSKHEHLTSSSTSLPYIKLLKHHADSSHLIHLAKSPSFHPPIHHIPLNMNQPHQQPSKNTLMVPSAQHPLFLSIKTSTNNIKNKNHPTLLGWNSQHPPNKRKNIKKQPATLPAPYRPVVQSEITARAAEARSKPAPAPPSEKHGRSGYLRHG